MTTDSRLMTQYVKSEHNIAHSLIKVKTDSIILKTIRSSKLKDLVEQWIIRRKVRDSKNFEKGGMSHAIRFSSALAV